MGGMGGPLKLFRVFPVLRNLVCRTVDLQVISMKRICLFLALLFLMLSGCPSATEAPVGGEQKGVEGSLTAPQILQRMIKTYQDATSYQDQGILALSYRYAGESRKDVSQASVSWIKPNHLRLRAYQLSLTVDGDKLRARVADESTNNIGNQLLVRHAGEGTSLTDLYEDDLVKDVLTGGRGGQPVQLELLMQEEPLQSFLEEDVSLEKMSAARIEGHMCERLAVKTPGGRYELWIDQQQFLLRRLIYPATSFVKDMLEDPQISDVQLVAELRSAELNPELAENEFALRVSEEAKQVERFVLPPQPLATDLYGKRVGTFQFQGLDGKTVSRESLAGKVSVLMWFTDHPANRSTVAALDSVASQFKNDPSVSIYAVCTEPAEVQDQRIVELKQDWKLKLPVVRDLEAYGRDVFRIPVAPTLVALDGRGRLHLFEAGPNTELSGQLPLKLKELVAGTSLADETLAEFAAEQKSYQEELSRAHQASLTSTRIKPASEPELFELERIWVNKDCQQPVNPLVVPEAGGAYSLFVLDGSHVVQLDTAGKTVERFDLKLKKQGQVSYLRTAVDGQGNRWFAAGQMGGACVYVFNSKWQQQFSFPAVGQSHPGIEDFQLADLDQDGVVELYLGYRGVVGVQRVSLSGLRSWGFRGVEGVLSLAAGTSTDKDSGHLLVTTEGGALYRLDPGGQSGREVGKPEQSIHHLFRAGFSAGQGAQFCGIVSTRDRLAVGFDRKLQQVWEYELPAGTFPNDLRFVQGGELLPGSGGQWLIAAADGTLHIVDAAGGFADQFATGQRLNGFTVGRLDDQALLFLADQEAVTAWKVSRRRSTN